MPEITSCPDCEKKLKVPDNLIGKKVRCPGCTVMFVAQAGVGLPDTPPPPPPAKTPAPRTEAYSERRGSAPSTGYRDDYDDSPRRRDDRDEYDDRPPRRDDRDDYDDDRRPRSRRDDYDDRDRPRRRDDDDDDRPRGRSGDPVKGWRGTRMGLNLVILGGWLELALWGIGVIGFGIFMLAGVGIASSITGAPQDRMPGRAASGFAAMGLGILLFGGLVFLIWVATVVLKLIGYGMCMMVPTNSRNSATKGMAIAAFSCAAAAVFLDLVGCGFNGLAASARYGGGFNVFGLLSYVLGLAGFVCWLIFLRSAAIQLRGSDVGHRVIIYLIVYFAFWTLAILLWVVIIITLFASVFSAFGANTAQSAGRTMGAWAIFAIIMGALVGLGALALKVWHIFLVTQVRGLVDRQLARM